MKDHSIQKGLLKQHVSKAEKHLKEKNYREALINADQAILVGEGLAIAAKAYHVRAKIHKETKFIDLAIQDISKAIELNPHCIEFYETAAECYYDNGEYMQAVKLFTKSIEHGKIHPKIYGGRALAYIKLGKPEDAEQDRITAVLPEWFTEVNPTFYDAISAVLKSEDPHHVKYETPDDSNPNGTVFFGWKFAGKGFDAKTGKLLYIS